MSEKMIFCLGNGRFISKGEGYQNNLRIFNKDVTQEEFSKVEKILKDNYIKIALTHWVEEKDMTKDDKINYPNYAEIGGYLEVFGYEEAWGKFWKNATQKQKDCILNIPQFDSVIFKGITGIDVEKKEAKEMTVAEISKKLGFEVKVIK